MQDYGFWHQFGEALLLALGMFWEVGCNAGDVDGGFAAFSAAANPGSSLRGLYEAAFGGVRARGNETAAFHSCVDGGNDDQSQNR
jgi:hypothetical protein